MPAVTTGTCYIITLHTYRVQNLLRSIEVITLAVCQTIVLHLLVCGVGTGWNRSLLQLIYAFLLQLIIEIIASLGKSIPTLLIFRIVGVHDIWLYLVRSTVIIWFAVLRIEQWRSCKLKNLAFQSHRTCLGPTTSHRRTDAPREIIFLNSQVELLYHPVHTLLYGIALELARNLACFQNVIHDRNTTKVLEGIEEGIYHKAACLSLQTVLFGCIHILFWSTVNIC